MISSNGPSLTRVRSSRLTKKVNCETLILSNVDCKLLPCNEQSILPGDKDHIRIDADSNAGKEQHAENDSKLTSPSYGNEKLPCNGNGTLEKPLPAIGRVPRRLSFAQFLHKVSRCECNMLVASSPERLKKPSRKLSSSAHRLSGLLPHSGSLILPIGSHSGPLNNMNSKAPVLLKASSIIPRNAVAGKLSVLPIKDPSSPKVTCLGRVRIKHKQSGQRSAAVLDDGKGIERQSACFATYLISRERKHGTGYHSATSYRQGRGKLGFSVDMLATDDFMDRSKGRRSTEASKLAKHLTGNSEGKPKCFSKEESKLSSQVKIRDHKMNACDQKGQIAQDVSPLGASCSEAEFCINLRRFASKSQQQLGINAASSSFVVDTLPGYENSAGKEGVRQVPPPDALLLMRNSRSKNVQMWEQDRDSTCTMREIPQNALFMIRNSGCKGSYEGGLRCTSSSELLSAEAISFLAVSSDHGVGKVVTTIEEQIASHEPSLSIEPKTEPSKMWEPSSTACYTQERVFCLLKQSSIHRQGSLPNAHPSLWQRRAVRKPHDLDVRTESRHLCTT
ncbi:hypothetical protein L7F22_017348 [Adiantum nelumboides]|nr:hypothetical protein [Adiantum nelumboides]